MSQIYEKMYENRHEATKKELTNKKISAFVLRDEMDQRNYYFITKAFISINVTTVELYTVKQGMNEYYWDKLVIILKIDETKIASDPYRHEKKKREKKKACHASS